MEQTYEVFEILTDGTVLWRDLVRGRVPTRARLDQLAKHSANEFFAVDLTTRQVVERVNAQELNSGH